MQITYNDMDIDDIQAEIDTLKQQLASPHDPLGDWKMIKYQEYVTTGLEPPYDDQEMEKYHEARQEIRDRINALQETQNEYIDKAIQEQIAELEKRKKGY